MSLSLKAGLDKKLLVVNGQVMANKAHLLWQPPQKFVDKLDTLFTDIVVHVAGFIPVVEDVT